MKRDVIRDAEKRFWAVEDICVLGIICNEPNENVSDESF